MKEAAMLLCGLALVVSLIVWFVHDKTMQGITCQKCGCLMTRNAGGTGYFCERDGAMRYADE